MLIHRVVARLDPGGPAMHAAHLAQGMNDGRFQTRLLVGDGFLSLLRGFLRERPEIVHTHGGGSAVAGRIAAILARVPVRVHTAHGGHGGRPRRLQVLERILDRFTRRIVVLARAHERELLGRPWLKRSGRVRMIVPGLEFDRLLALPLVRGDSDACLVSRAMLGIDDDTWVIGIVGAVVPAKNHELLFDAVASLDEDDIQILVVGDGERVASLRGYAAMRGLEHRVAWLGWRSDLADLYPAMDVLALPSHHEGPCTAVIEALAAGVTVVARAVGDLPELLDFGRLGRLVAEDDEDDEYEDRVPAFAMALTEALEDPPAIHIRREAREKVARRNSVRRMLRETEALYLEALAEAGLAAPAQEAPPVDAPG